MTCLQVIVKIVSIVVNHCLHDNSKCPFWTGILPVLRNGYFAIMLSAIVDGSVEKTNLLRNREENFIRSELCLVYVEIFKQLSTTNHSTGNADHYYHQISRFKADCIRKRPSFLKRRRIYLYLYNESLYTAQLTVELLKVFLLGNIALSSTFNTD